MQLRLSWPTTAADNPDLVNQFVVYTPDDDPGTTYILCGHAVPPVVLNPDDVRDVLTQLDGRLPVHPRGAFVMTRAKAEELHRVLGDHLGKNSKAD